MEPDGDIGEVFTSPVECYDECPEKVGTIKFSGKAWRELQAIQETMNGNEFCVYLTGVLGEVPVIDGYYLPAQEVTPVEATVTEENIPDDIAARVIGHLHSHHRMGATPSGVDRDHQNHPIHIIITTANGYSARITTVASCGKRIRSQANIVLVEEDLGTVLDKIKVRAMPVSDRLQAALERRSQQATLFDGRIGEEMTLYPGEGEDYYPRGYPPECEPDEDEYGESPYDDRPDVWTKKRGRPALNLPGMA